ncbi:hypothetical protein [Alteromonas gilva]|uniref:Uncharacterized protein n=1 Tax=Alteromonas gilva TaxID=2987522 RepID=A0ABT5KY55_9ALTE|nr:hypothetical protein [Alteromonas gilva]MDC8829713.1 hypothetical protein [Alteromonas gilva]
MPNLATKFQSIAHDEVDAILSDFTKENFVGGQAAYKLEGGDFNIDAGENNFRAYYDEAERSIKFICRYQRDMHFYDKKLSSFASKYGIETKK